MVKSKIYSYSKDELQKIVDDSTGYSDVLVKIGLCPKGGNPKTLKRIINEYGIDTNQMDKNRHNKYVKCAVATHKKRRVSARDVLLGKAKSIPNSTLLKRLVEEGYKENRCEICGIENWQNKPITLQLHHIDGNRNNNHLDNLQILCPNCHTQTDNYGGKKLKKCEG